MYIILIDFTRSLNQGSLARGLSGLTTDHLNSYTETMRLSVAFCVLWAASLVSIIVSPCTVDVHAPRCPFQTSDLLNELFYPCRNTLMLVLAGHQWKNWMKNLTMWKYSATNTHDGAWQIVLHTDKSFVQPNIVCAVTTLSYQLNHITTGTIVWVLRKRETHEYISKFLPCLWPTGWCALLWPGMTSEYSRAHPSLVGLATVHA